MKHFLNSPEGRHSTVWRGCYNRLYVATVINTKYSIPVAAHARPQFVRVGSHKARFFGAP